jgi:phage replication O-like protein O
MANPQLEDGYTSIANELLEAIYNTHLSEYESRTLWFIIRMTYGWKQKVDTIALSQFEKGIIDRDGRQLVKGLNINHSKICQSLNNLFERNIIIKNREVYITSYGLQKNYEQWDNNQVLTQTSVPLATSQSDTSPLATSQSDTSLRDTSQLDTPPVTNQTLPSDPLDTETSDPLDTETSDPLDTNERNERKKETITKTILPKKQMPLTKENVKLIFYSFKELGKYKNIDFEETWIKFEEYWFTGKRKIKRPKSASINWLNNDLSFSKNGYKNKSSTRQPLKSSEDIAKENEEFMNRGNENVSTN